jgi:hypothetical protein
MCDMRHNTTNTTLIPSALICDGDMSAIYQALYHLIQY